MSRGAATRRLRELERVESRVLAALRFVDAATGADVTEPLDVRAAEGEATFVRNRSGRLVLVSWSGLPEHEGAFSEPPAAPAPGSLSLPLVVGDPLGRYLPRRVALRLPRDPGAGRGEDSLFVPRVVPLHPAPRSRTGANWAVLRVSLTEQGSGDALGGALVRVRREGAVVARGLTDGRGEGLVAAVGIPLLTFGSGEEAVVVDEVAVEVEATFDPSVGTRMTGAALRSGATPPVPLVDPDALEEDADTLPGTARTLDVAAGRSHSVSLSIDLP